MAFEVKRAKVKDAFTGGTTYNKKDFKFQRVPGLTGVAAVRSTTFGVFAAIRKDCDMTRCQIVVETQKLWQDLRPLLSISELAASELSDEEEENAAPRFWAPALPKDLFDPLRRAVLASADIETDVERHLRGQILEDYDVEVCTTTSNVRIPVHGFILAARSPFLRDAFDKVRNGADFILPEVRVIKDPSKDHEMGSRSAFRVEFSRTRLYRHSEPSPLSIH